MVHRLLPLAVVLAGLAPFTNASAACTDAVPCSYTFSGPSLPAADSMIPQGMQRGRYISSAWNGPVTIKHGGPGGLYSADFTNTAQTSGHQEFDLSITRTYDSNQGKEQGFGSTQISALTGLADQELTYKVSWPRTPVGHTHINTIMFLDEVANSRQYVRPGDEAYITAGNALNKDPRYYYKRQEIDFTVSDFFQNPEHLASYNGETVNGQEKRELGSFTDRGASYRVFRRFPGDLKERASYLIVRSPKAPTSSYTGVINPKKFLKWVTDYEAQNPSMLNAQGILSPILPASWYLEQMGVEITGQSGDGITANNGSGKVEFTCYSIPTLNGRKTNNNGTTLQGFNRCDTGTSTPTTTTGNPVVSMSNAGPVVAGRVTNVPVGWTVLFTAATGTSRPNRSTTTTNAAGDFSLNLAQYPEFVDGITVNYYSAVSGKPAATGSFIYKAQQSTQPQITISNVGPIVQGRAANVPQGWTVLLTASTGTSKPNRSAVTMNTLGDFSLDLRQYPEMTNGMVVNYYTQASSGQTSSGTFTYVR